MTIERFNFITRDEFTTHQYKIDHKFDDSTNIMLGEFDKVHGKTAQIDTRLDSIEIRLTTLTEDSKELKQGMKNMNNKLDIIIDRLNIHDEKFGEHDKLFSTINSKLDAILIK